MFYEYLLTVFFTLVVDDKGMGEAVNTINQDIIGGRISVYHNPSLQNKHGGWENDKKTKQKVLGESTLRYLAIFKWDKDCAIAKDDHYMVERWNRKGVDYTFVFSIMGPEFIN